MKQKKYKDEQQYIRTASGEDLAENPFIVVATTATDYNSVESPSAIGFIRPPSTVTPTLSAYNRWIRIRKHREPPPPLHQIHFSASISPLRLFIHLRGKSLSDRLHPLSVDSWKVPQRSASSVLRRLLHPHYQHTTDGFVSGNTSLDNLLDRSAMALDKRPDVRDASGKAARYA
ncbi:unnamed protein product [Vicia faba]|uniref:Uncharacterized protein n=1 Tax=Vicia faba TaxID=3906 RepID=A0AAV0ZGA1_VICFA|nr:unnamed protein product [Vicia faba]